MAMAVSTRDSHGDATGNHFVPTRLTVPVVPKEPSERFGQVRAKITNVRHEPAIEAADAFAGVAAALPTSVIVGLLRNQTSANGVITIIPAVSPCHQVYQLESACVLGSLPPR